MKIEERDVNSKRQQPEALALIYANLRGNVGDFAIIESSVKILHTLFPMARIDLYYQGHPQRDQEKIANILATYPHVTLRNSHPWVTERGNGRLSDKVLWPVWKVVQSARVRRGAKLLTDHAQAFSGYQAVFTCGGELYNGKHGINLFSLVRAISAHTPLYSLPFACDPSMKALNTRSQLRASFSSLQAPILVRDGYTAATLSELGVAATLCGDSAHVFADEIAYRVATPDDPTVLLAISGPTREHSLRQFLRRNKTIGRKFALLTTREYLDGQFLRALSKEFEIKVHFPQAWPELVDHLGQAQVVVTNLLHVAYFARMRGVPLLLIADRAKISAFARDTSIPSLKRLRSLHPCQLDRAVTTHLRTTDTLRSQVEQASSSLWNALDTWAFDKPR